jgi:CheY-like chemotaxis protein
VAVRVFDRPDAAKPLVLIIEDRGDARERCAAALADAGFRVRSARTGFEGIVKAAALHPDIILINPGLSGLDGCETARLLKGCCSTATIPLIAYADGASAPASEAIEAAGFGAVIARTDPDEILVRQIGALIPGP